MGIFRIGFSVCGFIIGLLLELCLFLDSLIYGLADQALKVFFDMARLSADVQAYSKDIGYIMSRIMVLAGVYALFKLAVMLINYLLDPNKVSEASKNGSAIIKSVIIAVVLLVVSPIIFEYLGKFQLLIIENDVIPNLIYGPPEDSSQERFNPNSESKKFVNNVFLLFFTPSSNDTTGGGTYARLSQVASGAQGIDYLFGYAGNSDIKYTPIISGIAGLMLVYYFIMFSLELGKRLLKLAVLQVLSPIPIIMSVDPSQKNKLSNFIKSYSGLYIQIFIRIITVYLAFVILGFITNWEGFNGFLNSGMLLEVNFFIKLLLYIAVFQAANELPKLIEDALGVKMGAAPGGQSFGSVLKGIIGGAAGFAGGAIAGGMAGGFGGALAGAGSGLVGGAMGAAASKNVAAGIKSTVGSIKGSYGLGGKIKGAGGLGAYALGGAQNFFGGQGRDKATLEEFDKRVKAKDELIAGSNKKIEGFNKDISASSDKIGIRDKADQLRGSMEQSLDQAFRSSSQSMRSLESYMASDAKLQQLQAGMQEAEALGMYSGANGLTNRQHDIDRINERKAELEINYEKEKETFSNIQLKNYAENLAHEGDDTYTPKMVDAEFKAALDEYNSYVSNNDMSDRRITTKDQIEISKSLNEADRESIQKEIEDYRGKIEAEQKEIETREKEKKRIEQEKKDFQGTSGYVRRNNREEPPHPNPRRIE